MTKPNWTELQKLTTINDIADAVHENAKNKGFHDDGLSRDAFLERSCMLVVGEVAELHEAVRKGDQDMMCDKTDKMLDAGLNPLTCAEEELADIVIRAFDISRRAGIDIHCAILSKHAYNTTRPHKHGKKF